MRILSTIACFLLVGCAATRASAPAPSTVREDVERFFAAMRAGDLATIESYLADDYFLIGVGGNTRDRAGRIGWLRENVQNLSTVTPTDLRIRDYGNLAVVTGLVVIHDETPPIFERFTHVWLRQPGGWRMVSGQVTAVAPEYQPK
jgi:ketosteroid isomerase-like protein